MDLPTERPSVAKLLADAFDVRDPVVAALISELEIDSAEARRASLLARKLGLRNRFDLAHRLSRSKVPCLSELRASLRVLKWVRAWEAEGAPLSRQALREGQDPAVWYRTVKHVTGRCWSDIRRRGTYTIVADLRQRHFGGSKT